MTTAKYQRSFVTARDLVSEATVAHLVGWPGSVQDWRRQVFRQDLRRVSVPDGLTFYRCDIDRLRAHAMGA